MYKLVYEEYGVDVILTSTDSDPLLLLIKELFQRQGDQFELVFYGKDELGTTYNKNQIHSVTQQDDD